MLEANPMLTPQQVKRILLQTAVRLPNLEVDRQGWGAIQPKAAVDRALAVRNEATGLPPWRQRGI
jgi:serine protease AprX